MKLSIYIRFLISRFSILSNISVQNVCNVRIRNCQRHFVVNICFFIVSSGKQVKPTTTTKPAAKKAAPKLPEVLLKKRKLYADLKARRLRAQVQATKVRLLRIIRYL